MTPSNQCNDPKSFQMKAGAPGMRNERELISKVVSFLHDNGYPDDSILLEYAIPRNNGFPPFRADITIVEPRTARPVAIVELKLCSFSKQWFFRTVQQINARISHLRSPLRAYLVFPSNNQKGFAICDITRNENEKESKCSYALPNNDEPHIVSFDNLIRGNLVERHSYAIERSENHRDEFICWRRVGIVLLGGIFVREYQRNGWGLSWECLSVLCGVFILWLLRYFDVIGLKEITLQRHQDTNENPSETKN
jgi:hypothetical protein